MENGIDSYVTRWNTIRILSLAFLLLTFSLLTVSFPPWTMAGLAAFVGIIFGSLAVLKEDRIWARNTSLIIAVMFSFSLFWNILSSTVEENLAMLLLLFVIVVFSVEELNLLCRHQKQYSKRTVAEFPLSMAVLKKSIEHTQRQIGRLGLILGSCYVIAIGIVYLGALLVSSAPVQFDTALYVVVVSTSLALLMILREKPVSAEDAL